MIYNHYGNKNKKIVLPSSNYFKENIKQKMYFIKITSES